VLVFSLADEGAIQPTGAYDFVQLLEREMRTAVARLPWEVPGG
jgi:hypothetical protein